MQLAVAAMSALQSWREYHYNLFFFFLQIDYLITKHLNYNKDGGTPELLLLNYQVPLFLETNNFPFYIFFEGIICNEELRMLRWMGEHTRKYKIGK